MQESNAFGAVAIPIFNPGSDQASKALRRRELGEVQEEFGDGWQLQEVEESVKFRQTGF